MPDREVNEKFGHKLDTLTEMRDHFRANRPEKSILVGDLNIAPREDDVWSHKQLLKIVSHTPIEVEHLTNAQEAGGWVDVTRADIPEGLLYSWWSYRARDWDAADKGRRLDHIWASGDIAAAGHGSRVLREARGWEQPSDHAPVFCQFRPVSALSFRAGRAHIYRNANFFGPRGPRCWNLGKAPVARVTTSSRIQPTKTSWPM